MSEPSSSLFRETATGVFWSGGGQVLAQVVHLLSRLILARLLAPEDFGLVAMAMVATGFTYWFLDLGTGPALVQRPDLAEEHKSTAFWVNLAVALVVFVGLALLSPLISQFFGAPRLVPILIALGFSLVLAAPSGVPESLFAREFGFQLIALRRFAGTLLGGVVGIGLAVAGFGVWALVAQTLVNYFVGSLLLLVKSPWRPRLIVSREAFVDLWTFSWPLVGGRLLNYFNRNLDTILIGRFLDTASLGYYNLGYQLVLMPLMYVTRPITRVLFTAMCRLQDQPERLRKAYLEALQSVAFVTFPLLIGLALSAPRLVPGILGEKWEPASPLFPFLCLVGLVQSLLNIAPSVLQATGDTPMVLRWTLVLLLGNGVAFIAGVQWGIQGVAVAYAASTLLLSPLLLHWLLKILGLEWRHLLRSLRGVLVSTLALILVWFVLDWFFTALGLEADSVVILLVRLVLAGVAYLAVSWRQNRFVRSYARRLTAALQIRQRIRKT